MDLGRFPRVRLAHLPTPLEPLPRLSAHLGGPEILVKRDDCTGLALGGNKTRKLEFLIGAARDAGADTVITTGGVQSNHVRQTAAAAARLSMACELVLTRIVASDQPDYEATGNVLLDRLLGARLHVMPGDTDRAAAMAERAAAIGAAGGRPYVIPTGGSSPVGALGYAAAALELVAQLAERGLSCAAVVHATASGGTQAGLTAGMLSLGHPARVIGVDVDGDSQGIRDKATAIAGRLLSELGHPEQDAAPALEVVAGYSGPGYGVPTAAMREALELAARLEGLLLDPVYSGKAMAGLIGMIRDGRFGRGERVVFLHSGGTPALFAYRDVLAQPQPHGAGPGPQANSA